METIIQTVKEKIKSLEWDKNYHQNKVSETVKELELLQIELEVLQESLAHQTLV